jgi:Mrp family chromosome partitioning ATPase
VPPKAVPAGAARISPAPEAEPEEAALAPRARKNPSAKPRKKTTKTVASARRKTTRKKASTRKSASRKKATTRKKTTAGGARKSDAARTSSTTTLDAARMDQATTFAAPEKAAPVLRPMPSLGTDAQPPRTVSRAAAGRSAMSRSARAGATRRVPAPHKPRPAAQKVEKTILLPTAPPTPIGLPIAGTPQANAPLPPADPQSVAPIIPSLTPPEPAPPPAASPRPAATPSRDSAVALRPRPGALAVEGADVESCRELAFDVCRALDARSVRSLAVTSAAREEGRTTVACNLAVALARVAEGRRIALVDLDLRHPATAQLLGINQGCGIETVLAGRAPLEAARVAIDTPSFDAYPAYSPQRSAHEVLSQPVFAEVMAQLREHYDIVLIDTPPILVPDTALVLAHGGACLPIARVGRTRARSFERMLARIPRDQVLGEVLNEERTTRRSNDAYGDGAYSVAGRS